MYEVLAWKWRHMALHSSKEHKVGLCFLEAVVSVFAEPSIADILSGRIFNYI
jgi:hypothetical protein